MGILLVVLRVGLTLGLVVGPFVFGFFLLFGAGMAAWDPIVTLGSLGLLGASLYANAYTAYRVWRHRDPWERSG